MRSINKQAIVKYNIVTLIFIEILFGGFSVLGQPRGADPSAIPKEGVITGVIQDSASSGPIEYATVGIYRMNDSSLVNGTVTGTSGSFRITGIPYGSYYLEANFLGYDKKRISSIQITSKASSIDLGKISLHAAVTEIGAVEVVAQSQRVEYKIDKKVVNVSQDITAAGGTLVNVLENTPSVQVDVEGNVTLRGSGNFQLLIDGKPSVIQGSEGLQQIPASAVQSLEIITSPSAKYDPDGEAGIINVIMKKQKNNGIGGIVNASIGTREKYTADFLLNIRRDKINFYIGGEYADQNFHMNGESERRTYLGDTTTYILTNSNGHFARNSLNFKTGFDYYIDRMSTLSLSGGITNRKFNRDFYSRNTWFTGPASIDSFYREDNTGSDKDLAYNLNLDFIKKYNEKNHMLQASLYYSSAEENELEDQLVRKTNDRYEVIGQEPVRSRSRTNHPETNLRLELDYTHPVGSASKVEMGLQSRWDIDEANYIYEDYQPLGNEWIHNDSISNSLNYLDAIQSAYGIYSGPLGKFEYQLGLRAEYDNRTLDQKTSQESFTYQKMHFFPSFYIIRKLSDAHQLQFTYSRRIQRPRERELNPFKEFRGSNMVFYGNPALRPEFTNAFELNYQYTFKKGFLSLETYYRRTTDKITRISGNDSIAGKQLFFNTSVNADRDYSLGVELMTNLDLNRWWQLNLTGNFYHYQLQGQVDDSQVTSTSTTWRTNFSTMFKLKWDTRIQFMGFYNGPSNTLQGKREGFFVANMAIRKEMLKKQLSVSLNVRDMFATGRFAFTSEGPDFYMSNNMRRESPVVTINLTYRLNNYKQAARRNNGNEAEEMNGFEEM
jgi:outer membrane receptor protein involved in Fe transport